MLVIETLLSVPPKQSIRAVVYQPDFSVSYPDFSVTKMDETAFLPNREMDLDKADFIRIQELEAHSLSQAATIRTLKSLLEQSREECEQLRIGVTIHPDTASNDQTGLQGPSTAPKSFCPTMQRAPMPSEPERKVKYLEIINVKMAKEVCFQNLLPFTAIRSRTINVLWNKETRVLQQSSRKFGSSCMKRISWVSPSGNYLMS